jgi:hypothetical protein
MSTKPGSRCTRRRVRTDSGGTARIRRRPGEMTLRYCIPGLPVERVLECTACRGPGGGAIATHHSPSLATGCSARPGGRSGRTRGDGEKQNRDRHGPGRLQCPRAVCGQRHLHRGEPATVEGVDPQSDRNAHGTRGDEKAGDGIWMTRLELSVEAGIQAMNSLEKTEVSECMPVPDGSPPMTSLGRDTDT